MVTEINPSDWGIDTSTSTKILVYKKCSVIEEEQAELVLALLRAATRPTSAANSTAPMQPSEVALIEKAAIHVGMKSLMNNGAASCVYSEGCNGVTQAHLIAFAREIALHCAVALAAPTQAAGGEALEREIVAWLRNEATYEDDRCNTRRAKRFNDAANFIERAAASAAHGIGDQP